MILASSWRHPCPFSNQPSRMQHCSNKNFNDNQENDKEKNTNELESAEDLVG